MDKEKSLVRRSERIPKPKYKEGERKIQHPIEDIARKNQKKAKTDVLMSTEVSVKTNDDTAADKTIKKPVVASTSQPSASSVVGICKKQDLRKTAKKLGLFVIDCEEIVGHKKINVEALKTYLQHNLKNEGKTNDERINFDRLNMQVLISAEIYVEQNYIKFLLKKYLKKTNLHNFIKIVPGKKVFTLKYIMK